MGVDIPDINMVVNIGLYIVSIIVSIDFNIHRIYLGIPRDSWKVSQQSGRCGRNGQQSVCVTLTWPGQKGTHTTYHIYSDILNLGNTAPAKEVRTAYSTKGNSCLRDSLNSLFTIMETYSRFSYLCTL